MNQWWQRKTTNLLALCDGSETLGIDAYEPAQLLPPSDIVIVGAERVGELELDGFIAVFGGFLLGPAVRML